VRITIVAGEASGDLHGAGVVRALKALDPACEITGIGGDKMQAAGMQLVFHIRELAFMGFWEVIQHLPLIRSVERTLEALVRAQRPDALLLIDYPGFNLRFARRAKEIGVKVVYYISPQVWAWHASRLKKMKGLLDKMLVVFPFELDMYRREGIPVEFVGHPLLEVLDAPQGRAEFCKRWGLDPQKKILGIFPGSRRQELERIFPAMLGAVRILQRDRDVQAAVGVSSVLEFDFVKSFLRDDLRVTLMQNATYDLMKNADVAIVTSGTATLETGYFQTPMIVVYKTSLLTYLIGRALVRIGNIGLVNIVAGESIAPELIQSEVNPRRLAEEAAKLLDSDEARSAMRNRLGVVKEKLGTAGASTRVAKILLATANG
jgi:lipid-A-disaccharide synthase